MGPTIKLYENDDASQDEAKTFVCFGVPRGGTSMVAGSMIGLGLFMGPELPDNQEDPAFAGRPRDKMIKTIQSRNSNFKNWGWKYPDAANYLDALLPSLRNPHMLIVFRDIVATAQRHIHNHNRPVETALHDILLQNQRNILLAVRHRVPTLLISYEKSVMSPESFLKELAAFTNYDLPCNLQPLIDFMKPNGYKPMPEHNTGKKAINFDMFISQARVAFRKLKIRHAK